MPTTNEQKLIYATRFNLALDLHGVAQKNQGRSLIIGDMFGLTQRGAARWVNGEVLPPKARRKEIANQLKVNFEWLEFGHGEPRPNLGSEKIKQLPIITQMEAKNHELALASFSGRKISFDTNANQNSFVIEVTGSAMEPRFGPGTLIVVDPTASIKDGDYVLVYIEKLSEVLFRQYVRGENYIHFVPSGPGFSSMDMRRDDKIIGAVVEMRQTFK